MKRYIAHLVGHPAHVMIMCGCTRVLDVKPRFLIERLGLEATIEDGEARMRCPKCKKRPRLLPKGDYGVTGGRDLRVNPPPMPGWVDLS
jgi:hypothetical protein